MGVIGVFRVRGRFFTYVKSGKGKLGCFGGMYGGLGGLMGWHGMAWKKWVEKKDGCPFLFLFVHKLVRQSLCPSIRPSLQKLMRIDFMLFASFWKKGGGGGGHPWVTLDCPEN